jgi:hypothetical protein
MIPSFSEFIFENRDPEFVKQMNKEFDRLKDDDEFLYRGIRYKTIEKNDSVIIGLMVNSKYEEAKPTMINRNMFKNYGNFASKK